jgi:hypothetical protein
MNWAKKAGQEDLLVLGLPADSIRANSSGHLADCRRASSFAQATTTRPDWSSWSSRFSFPATVPADGANSAVRASPSHMFRCLSRNSCRRGNTTT